MTTDKFLAKQIIDLSRRITLMEAAMHKLLSDNATDPMQQLVNEYVQRHGERVDKSRAAQLLGVTRATIYAMLRDGRLRAVCAGSKVEVRSIAEYLYCDERRSGNHEGHAEKLSE